MMSLSGLMAIGNRRAARKPAGVVPIVAEAAIVYAVGDVHGCLSLLRQLEQRIFEDAANAPGEKLIVMLGDYVDRGPDSAGVIEHLLVPPAARGFRRVCLAGNHEVLMAQFLDDPKRHRSWLEFGGMETLASYGVDGDSPRTPPLGSRQYSDMLRSYIPGEHVDFIRGLPLLLETPTHVFVHAGLWPGVPLAEQSEKDLLWMRYEGASSGSSDATSGRSTVHGHSIVQEPAVVGDRIAIDTGAYLTGRLTAVRLAPDEEPTFLSAGVWPPADQ